MALVVTRTSIDRTETTDDDLDFWLSRPVAERIAAVEILRRRVFGGDSGATGSRLQRVVASFNEHDVRYLVVGGYALAAHGLPRATDVIGRDDLLRDKIAADRPQDRADVHRMNRQPRQD